jgi:hypothetical protein
MVLLDGKQVGKLVTVLALVKDIVSREGDGNEEETMDDIRSLTIACGDVDEFEETITRIKKVSYGGDMILRSPKEGKDDKMLVAAREVTRYLTDRIAEMERGDR